MKFLLELQAELVVSWIELPTLQVRVDLFLSLGWYRDIVAPLSQVLFFLVK